MTKICARKRRGREAGYALLLTLWVTAVLTLLLLTVSMRVSSNLKAVGYATREMDAAGLARAGFWRVAAALRSRAEQGLDTAPNGRRNESIGTWTVEPADWSAKPTEKPPEPGVAPCWCEVAVEDAKAPLSRLNAVSLGRLPTVSPTQAEAVASFLRQRATAGGVRVLEELWQVEGMDGACYYGQDKTPGLAALVTPYHRGRVAINECPAEVLRVLPGVDAQLAGEIRQYLDSGRTFTRVEDLQHIPGVTPAVFQALADWVKVTPEYFRIRATGAAGGVQRQLEGVVKVSKAGLTVLWMEGG
jgi:hypothetical protein